MGNEEANTALRRKVEAGRTSVTASRQVTPAKALSTAFVQACDRRLGLVANVTSCSGRTGTLAELLDTIPEGGLLAVLEGPGESQGLMVFDPALLSAVIEKLMTGQLADRPPRPRRPTRTDAALAADVIDEILRGFEAPFLGLPPARWAAGFGYDSFLDDPRPLGLMFDDIDYRVHRLIAELEGGRRTANMVLAVPAEGRGPMGQPAPGTQRGVSATAPTAEPEEPQDAVPWAEALEEQVLRGTVALEAVLHRLRLPLGALEGLQPGQELPIPGAALDETMLVGADGSAVARGRLGQSGGRRAVRLSGGAPGESAARPADGASAEEQEPWSTPPGGAALPGPGMPAMPSLGAGGGADLTDPPDAGRLPDLPGLGGGDDAPGGDLDPLAGLPDLADLPPLPEAGGAAGGGADPLSALPELPDLPKV
ncbi:MAG: FliM/FliN family flagellar motor switch protein [Paracoccaceae bacterium]|jgi:flagellar motor switch protein FliM|nr:FliM/FliN family flagellar motor switch protein [Paracoccaceae bacterium]